MRSIQRFTEKLKARIYLLDRIRHIRDQTGGTNFLGLPDRPFDLIDRHERPCSIMNSHYFGVWIYVIECVADRLGPCAAASDQLAKLSQRDPIRDPLKILCAGLTKYENDLVYIEARLELL